MPWKTEWTSLKFPSQTFVVKDKIEVSSNHFHSSHKTFLTNEQVECLAFTQWETYVFQKSPPYSRLHHYLDYFKANLLYFILKMSSLKGVQAWPQQSLCSSSMERWFNCATPCLRRWCVSYSLRLIKGIFGAKKIINKFFLLQFSSSMIGRRVSVPLCSNIYNIWSRLHPFCL